MTNHNSILLTGASGHLGKMMAAGLISAGHSNLILPLRSHHQQEDILNAIAAELPEQSFSDHVARLIIIDLPPIPELQSLEPVLRGHNVREIIHCAGSLDYVDSASLKEGNIDFTKHMLSLGKALGIRRFVHLSSAFSSGYVDGLIKEQLHKEPPGDPTEYTRSKRESEALVAASSLPYLILRPSIVVGDSRDGRYSGKPYGLYQLWTAAERFALDRYRPVLHLVAPKVKLQVIHQDAFQAAFLAAYKHLPDNSVIHLVSHDATLPTVRQLFNLWNEKCVHPQQIYYHDNLDDIPPDAMDRRMRLWVEYTAINNTIASHEWQFDTANLDQLIDKAHGYADATLQSVSVCLDRFIADSTRIQEFLKKHEHEFAARTQIIEQGMSPV